jgi:hypothetical protein
MYKKNFAGAQFFREFAFHSKRMNFGLLRNPKTANVPLSVNLLSNSERNRFCDYIAKTANVPLSANLLGNLHFFTQNYQL